MRFKFSTDSVPPAERFEAFRDTFTRHLFQVDIVTQSLAPHLGIIDLTVAGRITFGQVCSSAAAFIRRGAIARACGGAWMLLNRQGRLYVAQGDAVCDLSPGEGAVFDAARLHEGR